MDNPIQEAKYHGITIVCPACGRLMVMRVEGFLTCNALECRNHVKKFKPPTVRLEEIVE